MSSFPEDERRYLLGERRPGALWATAPAPLIRIHPTRIISCGLTSDKIGDRDARTVR
jgi:hypothetical protein